MKVHILLTGIIKQVQLDDKLIMKIATANNVRFASVERWLREKSQKLTTATNLTIIREHLNIPETEVLTVEDDILV